MKPYYQDSAVQIFNGDSLAVLRELPDETVQTCVTSPPYWGLRDYKMDDQMGREKTPELYTEKMVEVFREVRRVLKNDGTLWLNLGDCYSSGGNGGGPGLQRTNEGTLIGRKTPPKGIAPKNLIGIPWRVAFALQADGWYLRQEIIWEKPNPMPESVEDRPTRAHEQIFLLSKRPKYFYDSDAIKEPAIYFTEDRKYRAVEGSKGYPTEKRNGIRKTVYKDARSFDGKHADKQRGHGRRHAGFNDRWDHMTKEEQGACMRNKRSVWTVATRPFSEAHFAVFPPDLIKPCILAGSREGDTVLDPFSGAGTTCFVSKERKRKSIGIELNPEYIDIAARRMSQEVLI